MHVTRVDRLGHLEVLVWSVSCVTLDVKQNIIGGTVVGVSRDGLLLHQYLQVLLEILCPATGW